AARSGSAGRHGGGGGPRGRRVSCRKRHIPLLEYASGNTASASPREIGVTNGRTGERTNDRKGERAKERTSEKSERPDGPTGRAQFHVIRETGAPRERSSHVRRVA